MKDPRIDNQQRFEAGPDGFRFVEDAGLGLVSEDFGKAPPVKESEADKEDNSE